VSSIEIFFEDIQPFSIYKKHINRHVRSLIISEFKIVGDVSIIFCSDKYLLDINKQYLNHDYFTDIITFDYVQNDLISGDLFISFGRIFENAKAFDKALINEIYRVIFHGVLHLVGYNDKSDDEQKTMTEKENYYLSEVDFRGKEI